MEIKENAAGRNVGASKPGPMVRWEPIFAFVACVIGKTYEESSGCAPRLSRLYRLCNEVPM